MSQIRTWLEAEGLGKYAEAFAAQDISVDLLSELSDADLMELGVASLGDRKRLLRAVAAMQSASATPPAYGAPRELGAAPGSAPTSAPASRGDAGERRHATVVFSDLAGYTAFSEAFDPEEVEAVMARVKREAIAVVERHGGHVNQFVGDEVIAVFGVPVARRDDPQRAVRAALELHRAVDAIAAGLTEKLGRVLSMHTGIQSGLVVARRSDSRSGDYSLTGDTVNTAARLRGLARPGEVVVSPQTWQQVSDYFEAEAGAPIEVKGKERPLVPWRIVAERVVHRAGSRPLVGRADETQQFGTLIRGLPTKPARRRGSCARRPWHRQVAPGRRVPQFGARARPGLPQHLDPGLWLDAPGTTRYAAWRKACSALPQMPTRPAAPMPSLPSPRPRAERSTRPSSTICWTWPCPPRCERCCQPSMSACGKSPHWMPCANWPAQTARAHPCCCWSRTSTGPTPGPSTNWARWPLRLAKQPLLLIMTTRFAGDPSVGDWRSALDDLPVCNIDLGPLSREDALRLAVGATSMSEALLRSCVERSEGNPLFLEQLLLNAGDVGAASLPGSIQALIQARMDWLLPDDKHALQAAAVWGLRVPLAALRHLLGEPDFDARALVEQFLLRPDGDELAFSHALIRDGAYSSLLHAERRELHLAAAQWIEDPRCGAGGRALRARAGRAGA